MIISGSAPGELSGLEGLTPGVDKDDQRSSLPNRRSLQDGEIAGSEPHRIASSVCCDSLVDCCGWIVGGTRPRTVDDAMPRRDRRGRAGRDCTRPADAVSGTGVGGLRLPPRRLGCIASWPLWPVSYFRGSGGSARNGDDMRIAAGFAGRS
jgi:hypothetical protein